MLLMLLGCGDPVAVQQVLTVVNVSPSHGAANIGADTTVLATFNDDLVPDSWATTALLLGESDDVLATVTYANRTVTLLPELPLDPGATYRLSLTTGLTGEALGALPAPVETRFTVAGEVEGANNGPEAVIAEAACGALGEAVSLDGQGSSDPDGDSLAFSWRVVHGPEEGLIEDAEEPVARFTPAAEGLYLIGLVVSDGLFESSEAFLELDCPGAPQDTAGP